MTTKPTEQNEYIPDVEDVRYLADLKTISRETALAVLDHRRTFIEGRGFAEEYEALAYLYKKMGEEVTAQNLLQKAEALRNV